jgi:hypothetical protein
MSDRPGGLQYPPSWAGLRPPPSGAWCRACQGTQWWADRHHPRGWRCAACHPPTHLPEEAISRAGEGRWTTCQHALARRSSAPSAA